MTGGTSLGGFIDEGSLAEELIRQNPNYCPERPHPFAAYVRKVIADSGVQDSTQARQVASFICGSVAKLPFMPDEKEIIEGRKEDGTARTEFDLQVIRTAARAEQILDADVVWTTSARKLAFTALMLRKRDPDGSKGLAWVNDPLPGEPVAA
jgi:hypothetical protein